MTDNSELIASANERVREMWLERADGDRLAANDAVLIMRLTQKLTE